MASALVMSSFFPVLAKVVGVEVRDREVVGHFEAQRVDDFSSCGFDVVGDLLGEWFEIQVMIATRLAPGAAIPERRAPVLDRAGAGEHSTLQTPVCA
jgi:hypothetical protein